MSKEQVRMLDPDLVLEQVYPDASAIFKFKPEPLDLVLDTCLVVLDTGALLVPYKTGKESFEQIKKTYEQLVSANRLVIRGRVAREFAKQRSEMLGDIHKHIADLKSQSFNRHSSPPYPLLESLPEYRQWMEVEKKIIEPWKERQRILADLVETIRSWRWNDPVSELYRELFSSDVVVDRIPEDEAEFTADRDFRFKHKIPPGYKDSSKEDGGVGDLLIWRTILAIGEEREEDVVFVSHDRKTDWWSQSGGASLYPRFELVDEFRRSSWNHSLHIIGFADLLSYFGAPPAVIDEVRHEEVTAAIAGTSGGTATAKVESIRTVSSGSLVIEDHDGPARFLFGGDGFSIKSAGVELGAVGPVRCRSCRPGEEIDMGAYFAGSFLGTGDASWEGLHHPYLSFGGEIKISAPHVLVPDGVNSSVGKHFVFTAPFSLSARLSGYEKSAFIPEPDEPSLRTTLAGEGTAVLELERRRTQPAAGEEEGELRFHFRRVMYALDDELVTQHLNRLAAAGANIIGATK